MRTGAHLCSLSVQQGLERRKQSVGDDLRALGSGMDTVALDGVGNVDQAFVYHRYKGGVMLGRKIAEDLFEHIDVVVAVVWRKRDAGKQNFNVCVFKGSQYSVEVAPGLIERKTS